MQAVVQTGLPQFIVFGYLWVDAEEGKLMNLLAVEQESLKPGRRVRCRCSKSRCGSKYC